MCVTDGCLEPWDRRTAKIISPLNCHDSSKLQIFLLGSTFKPLNPVKRAENNKKRSRRTTIMGIPNQVQKELGEFTYHKPVDSIHPLWKT